MPIRFAQGFDPAAITAMTMAFDKACETLGLARTQDATTEHLAKLVVEQARTGERDPYELHVMTMDALKRS